MQNLDIARPEVVVNRYKKATPLIATVIENKKLVQSSDSDVRHLVFDAPDYDYMEGQSAGILAPGISDKGKPHAVRLYSIASLGTDLDNIEKLSLCVKRLEYQDEVTGEIKKGICSNYLCDLQPGDKVEMTGPAGRKFILPAKEQIKRPYVFIATGTGIAPFRPMIQRLLNRVEGFSSEVHLLFGVRYQGELLYDDEFKAFTSPNFHYHTAISREQKNKAGGRRYVNDIILDNAEEMGKVLFNNEALIYICGLRGMEVGYDSALRAIAREQNKSEDEIENVFSRTITEVY